jgi:hypothetical protein
MEILTPGLPTIPGFTGLNAERREWLLEHTSNIARFRRQQAAGVIGECRELYLIQAGLEGTPVTMKAYIATMYPRSDRTAWKRLSDYRELAKVMPEAAIDALANNAAEMLQGAAALGAGDVIRAAKGLPLPRGHEPKVIEGYLGKLRERLREDRQARRKGRRGLDPDDAVKIAVTTLTRCLREAKLGESAAQRQWLKKVVGYTMERRAITGTVATERISIPDGFMPRRGRPRKDLTKAA